MCVPLCHLPSGVCVPSVKLLPGVGEFKKYICPLRE